MAARSTNGAGAAAALGSSPAAGVTVLASTFRTHAYAANEKLNTALIGVGGQGGAGHGMASAENVVAMCDADSNRMADFAKRQPQAKTYTDWRRLYDNHKDLNMVLVAVPDHTHFPAAYSAVIRGGMGAQMGLGSADGKYMLYNGG